MHHETQIYNSIKIKTTIWNFEQRMKNHCLLINSSYEYATKNVNTPKDKVLEHLLSVSSNLINYDLFKSSMIKIHQIKSWISRKRSSKRQWQKISSTIS